MGPATFAKPRDDITNVPEACNGAGFPHKPSRARPGRDENPAAGSGCAWTAGGRPAARSRLLTVISGIVPPFNGWLSALTPVGDQPVQMGYGCDRENARRHGVEPGFHAIIVGLEPKPGVGQGEG